MSEGAVRGLEVQYTALSMRHTENLGESDREEATWKSTSIRAAVRVHARA